jgi:anthranilate phosphoribosyltransferase
VYSAELTQPIARVLGNLGLKRAFVVYGEDGIDAVTITAKTRVSELAQGRVRTYTLAPSDFGFKKEPLNKITGGTAEKNSRVMVALLSGKKGPVRNMTVMNSAMALVAAGKTGVLKEAVRLAEFSIDSGRAAEKLSLLRKATHSRYSAGKTGKR